jgi:poly-gamma-glutamate synthesis protein (capsule biosynthesis protein)
MSGIIIIVCVRNNNSRDQQSEKEYLKFRAEGVPVSESILSGHKYVGKYLNKRVSAPDSIVEYFSNQAVLFSSLTHFNDQPKMLSLAFIGDIMWIRDNWSNFLSEGVKSYLEGNDMVFGNLETPIDTGITVPRMLPDYFSYNSSPELINSFIRNDGQGNIFTAVSVTNNHSMDRGAEGLISTMEFLKKGGIGYSGAAFGTQPEEDYFTAVKNGVKIGFYAASWGLNNPEDLLTENLKINVIPGIAPLDAKKIDLSSLTGILGKMSEDSVDIKILSLHWGYEYELYPDPEIIKMARILARNGADIIIGSHPHVVQPNEICLINGYQEMLDPVINDTSGLCLLSDSTGIPRKTLIIYCPGNFTTAMYTPSCRLGAIQSVSLFTNPFTGKIDWTVPEVKFVYNTPSDPVQHLRKLILWDDFITELGQKSPSKAARIKKETDIIFKVNNSLSDPGESHTSPKRSYSPDQFPEPA